LNSRGFTLLELLISITMLALITGIMGWSLSMAHRTLEKGERKIQTLERKKASFSIVESQILSMLPYQYKDDKGQKKNYFSGTKEKLMFASNYSLWRGARGNTLVAYETQTNEQGKKYLRITEQIIGLATKEESILFDNCINISFEYFLKSAFEEGNWVEEWPADEKVLPEKIKINIADESKKIALIVNPLVKPISALSSAVVTN
jgi:general secretion pathway protein J